MFNNIYNTLSSMNPFTAIGGGLIAMGSAATCKGVIDWRKGTVTQRIKGAAEVALGATAIVSGSILAFKSLQGEESQTKQQAHQPHQVQKPAERPYTFNATEYKYGFMPLETRQAMASKSLTLNEFVRSFYFYDDNYCSPGYSKLVYAGDNPSTCCPNGDNRPGVFVDC